MKVSFNHTPAAYTKPNQLEWNTFDDVIAKCAARGAVVVDDHIFADPLLGYVNPADNKCGTGRGNIGSGPDKPDAPAFNVPVNKHESVDMFRADLAAGRAA